MWEVRTEGVRFKSDSRAYSNREVFLLQGGVVAYDIVYPVVINDANIKTDKGSFL